MDKDHPKRVNRKRSASRAIIIGSGNDNALVSDMSEPALKGYSKSQDDSMVTKGKETSEQTAKLGAHEVQRDDDAETTKGIRVEPKPDSSKELRKNKQSAEGEIAQAMLSLPNIKSSRLRPRKEVPSFQMVELNENDSERIVGMRIKVYWPDSRKWFAGRIKSFNQEKSLHEIYYNDGDVEELNLRGEKFELEVKPSDGFQKKEIPRSKKAKKYLDAGVVHNTGMSLQHDKVKNIAEGETITSAEIKEHVALNQEKEQAADDSQKNNSEAASMVQNLKLTKLEKEKSLDIPKTKRTDQ